ncbi:MAG TPA: LysM peptidoglycan-binding domain-containing protein [Cytophaga sp.]|jgi:LysM repeat protein|nr:LysM peptidoglycan-binding domain-containing protein [Cytophaga sp.]
MMIKKVALPILLALISLMSYAGVQDSIGVTKLNNKLHVQYLISPGETIYGISTKYGISLSDLFEINPELENGLKVGQIINIPYNPSAMAKPAKPLPPDAQVYKVQPGDTYYGIAKKYNTSVEQLLKMNNMDLKAGQEIVVGYNNTAAAIETKTLTTTATPTTTNNTATTPTNTTTTVAPTTTKVTEPVNSSVVKTDQPVLTNVSSVSSFAPPFNDLGTPYTYDSSRKQILVVPFDPYLYFSDADDEIAAKSNMQRTKVREVFRRRLNTLLIAPGYETIHLLGGKNNDSLTDLNKIYSSVSYNYQATLNNPNSIESKNAQASAATSTSSSTKKNGNWIKNSVGTITGSNSNDVPSQYSTPADNGKYFGVAVRNPDFFKYFNEKYSIDYYIFINQFEVKTNYQNCLDRAALNYERTFIVHYSIFDANGKQIAGDKFKVHYNSNNCYVYQIVSDNVPKMAQKILNQLPPPTGN